MKHGYISEMFVSFQGEGAQVGRRHLFIRLSGCNLRCRYCDTPASLVREETCVIHHRRAAVRVPNPLGVNEVLDLARGLCEESGDIDGVAITGGEPLLQAEFLAALLATEDLPHPRLLETSGALPRQLLAVRDRLDIVSMDMKLPSNSGEAAFWEEHEEFLRNCEGRAYVKILVDEDTAEAEVDRAAAIVASVAPATAVFLQPISGEDGSVGLSARRLASYFSLAKNRVSDVRVIPQTHKMMGIR